MSRVGAKCLIAFILSVVWAVAEEGRVESAELQKRELNLAVQSGSTDDAKHVAVTLPAAGAAPGVSGTADVIGFPFIQSSSISDIDWKVDGSTVTGTITAKSGSRLGSFEGTITATGMSGKFTHVDGRVGLWSWDGPIPSPSASTP
jgi:hypothetical protein